MTSCLCVVADSSPGRRRREEPAASEHGTAPSGAVGPGAPAPAPGAGVEEPGALRGARRAWPQFPHPVTRLATLPRRVTAAKRRLRVPSLRSAAVRQGRCRDSRGYRTRVVDVPLHFVSRGHPGPLRVALRATFNIIDRRLCLTGAVVRSALRAVFQRLGTPLAHAPAASPAVRVAVARVLAPAPCGPRAHLRRGRPSRQAPRRPSAAASEGAGTASASWRRVQLRCALLRRSAPRSTRRRLVAPARGRGLDRGRTDENGPARDETVGRRPRRARDGLRPLRPCAAAGAGPEPCYARR